MKTKIKNWIFKKLYQFITWLLFKYWVELENFFTPDILVPLIIKYLEYNKKYFNPALKIYYNYVINEMIKYIRFSGNSYDRRKAKRKLNFHILKSIELIKY